MGFRNLFRKPTKKEEKKKQIRNNAEQGLSGEKQVVARYRLNGWTMKRTGYGHDYYATRKNPHTGKAESIYVEIKSGNAELSPLQVKKKAQYGSRYVVERVQVNPFMGYRGTNIENKDTANFNQSIKPYKKIKSLSSSNKIFSNPTKGKSTAKKSTVRKKPKSFSNAESLFGNLNASNPTKGKSTAKKSTVKKSTASKGLNWLLGDSSSSSKKSSKSKSKSSSNMDWFFGDSSSSSKKSSKSKSKSSSNMDWLGGGSSSSKKSSGSSNVKKLMGSGSGKSFKW